MIGRVEKWYSILGQVQGSVVASEKVEIREGGRLDGDIVSPRIAISDGAHFRGKVEMEKSAPAEKVSAGMDRRAVGSVSAPSVGKALA